MARQSLIMAGPSLRRCIFVLVAVCLATVSANGENLPHKRQLVNASGGTVEKAAQTIGVSVQKGASVPPQAAPAASAQSNQPNGAQQPKTPLNPAPQGPPLTPLANTQSLKPQAQRTQAQQPSNPTPVANLPARPTTVGLIKINASPNVAVNTASALVFSLFTPKAAVTLTLAAINAPAPGQQGLPASLGADGLGQGLNNGLNGQNSNGQNSNGQLNGNGQINGQGNGQINSQGNGQINGQGNGQINGQGNGQINSQGNGQINGQGNGQINGQQNGQNNGQIDIQPNGQNNGQINGQGNGQINGQGNGLVNNQPQVPASIGPALGTITVTQGPAGGAPGVPNAPPTAGIIGQPAATPSPNVITVNPGGTGSQGQPQQPQIPGQPQQPNQTNQPGQPNQPALAPAATVTVNVGGQGGVPQPQQQGQLGQPIQPNQPLPANGQGGQVVGLGPVPPASIVSIRPNANASPIPGVGNTGNVGAGITPNNVTPNLPQGLAGAVGPNACTCNCLCPPGSFNMGSLPQVGQMPAPPLGVNGQQPQGAIPGQQPAVTIVPQGQQGQQIPGNQGQQGIQQPGLQQPGVAPTTLATLPAASPQQQLPQPIPGQNPNGGNVGVQGPLGQLTIGGSVLALQTAVTQPLVKRRNPHQRPR